MTELIQSQTELKLFDLGLSELQIGGGIEDYSKMVFLISQQTHML